MSMVRFATLCDHCHKRSDEYSAFPSCRTCMDDVCPGCSVNADDETGRADCFRCLMDAALLPEGLTEGDPNVQICPNCGQGATFKEHRAHHMEDHGLDCGPYEHWDEEWLTCRMCGAETDYAELKQSQRRTA